MLHPTDDPFGDEAMAAETASILGGAFEKLDGVGHWWPLEAPDVAATALERFWSTLG